MPEDEEPEKDVISCATCIHKDEKKEAHKCFSAEDELQFAFCNYQKNKEIEK